MHVYHHPLKPILKLMEGKLTLEGARGLYIQLEEGIC